MNLYDICEPQVRKKKRLDTFSEFAQGFENTSR